MYVYAKLLRLRVLLLVSFTSIISEAASYIHLASRQQHVKHAFDPVTADSSYQLAVVVPTHRGELPRLVSSLQRWPSSCSPVTKRSVDLVLYYAEGDEDSEAVKEVVEVITATAGLCFATTRVVYAYLGDEVRPYTLYYGFVLSLSGTLGMFRVGQAHSLVLEPGITYYVTFCLYCACPYYLTLGNLP